MYPDKKKYLKTVCVCAYTHVYTHIPTMEYYSTIKKNKEGCLAGSVKTLDFGVVSLSLTMGKEIT